MNKILCVYHMLEFLTIMEDDVTMEIKIKRLKRTNYPGVSQTVWCSDCPHDRIMLSAHYKIEVESPYLMQ